MPTADRITLDSSMKSHPCIRDTQITVVTLLEDLAAGLDPAELLRKYPVLDKEDIRQALVFAAEKVEEARFEFVGT